MLPNIGAGVETAVVVARDVPNCTVGKLVAVPKIEFVLLLVGKVTVEVEIPGNEVAVVVVFVPNENSGLFDADAGVEVPNVNIEGVVDTPNPAVVLTVVFGRIEVCAVVWGEANVILGVVLLVRVGCVVVAFPKILVLCTVDPDELNANIPSLFAGSGALFPNANREVDPMLDVTVAGVNVAVLAGLLNNIPLVALVLLVVVFIGAENALAVLGVAGVPVNEIRVDTGNEGTVAGDDIGLFPNVKPVAVVALTGCDVFIPS